MCWPISSPVISSSVLHTMSLRFFDLTTSIRTLGRDCNVNRAATCDSATNKATLISNPGQKPDKPPNSEQARPAVCSTRRPGGACKERVECVTEVTIDQPISPIALTASQVACPSLASSKGVERLDAPPF